MNLVDSCGWLEYFSDSPYADFYAAAIEETESLIVPTITILEVFKRVLQQRGEDAALQVAAVMHQGRIVDLSGDIALRAAKAGIELKLPLADSIILATAQTHDALIWTQDVHFKEIEGVRYLEKI
jgi:predicted nucleic acid-binding protein